MQLNNNIIIIFIIIFFSSFYNIYSQEIEIKKKSVDSLFMLVKEITPNEKGEWLTKKLSVNDSDLEKAKKLLYDAYAYNQIEYNKKLVEWVKDWENAEIKKAKKDRGVRPGVRIRKIKEVLAEKYGLEYVKFLETPYFMKVKIIDINGNVYSGYDGKGLKVPQVDLIAEILEPVKGEQFYSPGQIITISYLVHWFQHAESSPHFKVNDIYFLPLSSWPFQDNKDSNYLQLALKGLHTLYKIENEKVICPLVPDQSPNKNWDEFKNEFINKFLIEN